jgi:hypothetical protein
VDIDAILGLPLHPLVVHAVVVLVPLLAIGMLVAVASRGWADRLRVVLAVLAVAAAGAGFVARSSGQRLLARVPGSPEVAQHVDVANLLPLMLLGTAALVLAWAWTSATGRPERFLGVAAAGAAVVATVWTVIAGHSGAVSVWGDLPS